LPSHAEVRLPWGQGTITIKGHNAGVKHITVFFDDEKLNIVDFLSHSLKAEYAALYETIMSAYEAKLKSGDIFEHNFPETKIICKEITTTFFYAAPPGSIILIPLRSIPVYSATPTSGQNQKGKNYCAIFENIRA
jgi:hypothetical protein